MISGIAPTLGISGIDFEGCYYITFRMEKSDTQGFIDALYDHFGGGDCEAVSLVGSRELPSFEKYDEYIPGDLLRHAYATDRLNVTEATARIRDFYNGRMP